MTTILSRYGLVFVGFLGTWGALAREDFLYTASRSSEAEIEFHGQVLVHQRVTNSKQARPTIDLQVQHMFGPMSDAAQRAVPRGDYKITQMKFVPQGDFTLVDYKYNGVIVLENGMVDQYAVELPLDPQTFYDRAVEVGGQNCLDAQHPQREYFWYFWTPRKYGCPLVAGQDYVVFAAKVSRIENSKETYPEYERLFVNGEMTVDVLMGMDDDYADADPFKSTDINASNYRNIFNALKQMGFQNEIWTEEQIRAVAPRGQMYVQTLSKKTEKGLVKIRMTFSPASSSYNSQGFYSFLADSLKNSSAMFYAGHSGLGEYLDVAKISRYVALEPAKDRYQIYYFNSCSSYSYYNKLYFKTKQSESDDPLGTKNLDIVTNGLATYFHAIPPSTIVFLKAFVMYAEGRGQTSYQKIAAAADSSNLLGINGDEDNPRP